MLLELHRKYKKEEYTIGTLSIDGKYFCSTLEDKDRGLHSNMSLKEVNDIKVYGKTAIPTGTYTITLNVISAKFSKYDFYRKLCNARMPRLLNVKGFSGILLHVADGPKGADLVEGCIGVGYNKIKGGLLEGKEVFTKLYSKLLEAHKKGEAIIIKIY